MRYAVGAALVLLALSLLTGVTQVQPGERAVVRRFGRVLDEKPGPGLYVGLPWGIDQVQRVPVDQVRRVAVGYAPDEDEQGMTPPGQLLSGDHNLINVQVVLDYAVDEQDVELFVVQADRADALVARVAEAALVEWAAGRRIDRIVREKGELPDWLVRQTQARLQPYRLGVRLLSASVTQLSPPAEVKEAFAEVTRANTEKETLKLEADSDALRRSHEAEQEQNALKHRAEGDADVEVNRAQEEVARFKGRLKLARDRGDRQSYLLTFWDNWRLNLLGRINNDGPRGLPPFDPYLSKNAPSGGWK
jgi:membrane protease subunit HflK